MLNSTTKTAFLSDAPVKYYGEGEVYNVIVECLFKGHWNQLWLLVTN